MLVDNIVEALQVQSEKGRSAWNRGVAVYAIMLLDDFEGEEFVGSPADRKALLNGADNWRQYSYGGCALIYDSDIAETLCSPSELKKVKGGERQPNSSENWLDVQARALYQAERMILRIAKGE